MSNLPPAPEAIVFDWDNTLVDTLPLVHRAVVRMLRAMGRTPWSEGETRRLAQHSVRDAFPALFGARAAEAERLLYAALAEEPPDAIRPLPGAPDMLDAARDLDVPLSIVSNKRGDRLRAEVHAQGWIGRFTACVGSGDAARDKPDPAPVRVALGDRVAGPGVWLVGDTPTDAACSGAAGCSAIVVGESDVPDTPADCRVGSCWDLGRLLRTYSAARA